MPAISSELAGRVFRFGLTSGIGLAIDLGVFSLLILLGGSPGLSNAVSATAAVTFVYFVSVYKVFAYRGHRVAVLFLTYLLYQAGGIAAASWAVAALSRLVPPLAAKCLILPVTFSANFLFMSWLTRSGMKDARRDRAHG